MDDMENAQIMTPKSGGASQLPSGAWAQDHAPTSILRGALLPCALSGLFKILGQRSAF